MNCSPNLAEQAMLYLSFGDDRIEAFKSQFYDAAKQYREKNISFLIGDATDGQIPFKVFLVNLHYFFPCEFIVPKFIHLITLLCKPWSILV